MAYSKKRIFFQPYLKCVERDEARYILSEVHGGICGDHLKARALIEKMIRIGYFWPTMRKEAHKLVQTCDRCQESTKRKDDNSNITVAVCIVGD